jgi:hypothetical protein
MLAPAFGELTRQPKGDSMKRKSKRKYRLVIDFNEHAVSRIRIKERATANTSPLYGRGA